MNALQIIEDLVNQVTLRKLMYTRGLLKEHNLPFSGPRAKIRKRLLDAIQEGVVSQETVRALLNELDAWGDQKVRFKRLSAAELQEYRSENSIREIAERSGLSHLLEGTMDTLPPEQLTPMSINFDEEEERLTLFAAKTRSAWIEQKDIPPKEDPDYPDVIFKPFKFETQKAVAFIEIDFRAGIVLFSTTVPKRGYKFDKEFDDLENIFSGFIPLSMLQPVSLYRAIEQIGRMPSKLIRLISMRPKTSAGGSMSFSSASATSDLRSDPELHLTFNTAPQTNNVFCNCYWNPLEETLFEQVHTSIYAPYGEITIRGQIREQSARYVLRQILQAAH